MTDARIVKERHRFERVDHWRKGIAALLDPFAQRDPVNPLGGIERDERSPYPSRAEVDDCRKGRVMHSAEDGELGPKCLHELRAVRSELLDHRSLRGRGIVRDQDRPHASLAKV